MSPVHLYRCYQRKQIAQFFLVFFHVMNWSWGEILWMFFVGLFVLFWIFTLLRVAKDISRRTNHLGTQVICIFIIVLLTPIIWLPVYFLLRPITRKDVLLQQQEITDLLHAQTVSCYACGWANTHEHMFCVFCWEKLKQACPTCKKRFVIWYLYCPFCATPANEPPHTNDEWTTRLF